jgi:hypothetical protein
VEDGRGNDRNGARGGELDRQGLERPDRFFVTIINHSLYFRLTEVVKAWKNEDAGTISAVSKWEHSRPWDVKRQKWSLLGSVGRTPGLPNT